MSEKLEKNILRNLSETVLPSDHLDINSYLQQLYSEIKKEVAGYSYTKFAEQLGFGATNIMHQFIKGRRPLTHKSGERILAGLGLVGLERRYFLILLDLANAKDFSEREAAMNSLLELKNKALPDAFDKDCLEYYSKWYHPVIREMVGISVFKEDAEWIAANLIPSVRPAQASGSLDLLKRLKLVKFDEEKGRLVQSEQRVTTGHRVRNMALIQYHKQMIDIAKQSLTEVKGQKRDISALTISVDQEATQKIKSMIHDFQLSLLEIAESSKEPDRIYHMNIQFFPVTNS
jgi:uncharacterized protein (TIGR02147 family)